MWRLQHLVLLFALNCFPLTEQRVSVRISRNDQASPDQRLGLEEASNTSILQQPSRTSGSRMHIVITHYSKDNLEHTRDLWLKVLAMDKIQALQPAVYIYCQNPLLEDLSLLDPLLVWGGQIEHVENLGRESHGFLLHILRNYHNLPDLVLFSQDLPEEDLMRGRIEKLLVRETGFLPLALVATEPCMTEWIPGGLVAQLFSWFRRAFCPPEGIAISFMGQFIVSRDRLHSIDLGTYQYMLMDGHIAPEEDWDATSDPLMDVLGFQTVPEH